MKKWIKITLIAAAVLAALIVIAAIAVSPVAKNYIEKHDRELIGRSIRMERLRMNIFTGRLRIEGLRIGGFDDVFPTGQLRDAHAAMAVAGEPRAREKNLVRRSRREDLPAGQRFQFR